MDLTRLDDAAKIHSLGAAFRWAWTGHNPATTRPPSHRARCRAALASGVACPVDPPVAL